MRRRLESFVPIVLFAVLVQLLAPIGAFRMVAQTISDPVAMSPICSGLMPMEDGQPMPTDGQDAQACCVFCPLAHAGLAAIDPPAPIFVHLQRQYHRVIWLEATDLMPTARVGSNSQARAPPVFS
jgi:hypothetical protein